MENNFNLRRIGLILKADWIEYKKTFLLFVALLLAANLFLLRDAATGLQVFLFVASLLCTLTYFYNFTRWKVHRLKNRFLTLPASALEKFAEILIAATIYFCVFILIYGCFLAISRFGFGTQIWFMQDSFMVDAGDQTAKIITGMITFLFICTFLFTCCFMFKKYPLPIGTLILILFGALCTYTVYLVVKIEGMDNFNPHINGCIRSNALIETTLFLNTYAAWALGIATLVLIYVSFLKLKEKQIR